MSESIDRLHFHLGPALDASIICGILMDVLDAVLYSDDEDYGEKASISHSKDLLASISHSVREMAPYVPRAASKSHSQYK